ncbi:receptor-type tyrosine-protein phosphatase alpha-like isoform X1 [Chlorocebus sabaeus]|uniref:receptor-type tyrosine-protein phosphatase alpha-like isoform X1 n=1 Tax=Chlorocebus sabaeus TaxID=60711 RepID=UPI003BF95035
MAEPVKEEAKTSNPTSSLTSLSVAPTFSRNITLGPVNSSDSDNGTTRTASTNCIGTTISANGMWLPDNQFTDARTEPWEGNSSTTATTPETFPPSVPLLKKLPGGWGHMHNSLQLSIPAKKVWSISHASTDHSSLGCFEFSFFAQETYREYVAGSQGPQMEGPAEAMAEEHKL